MGLNLQGWYQFGIPARSNEGQYDGGMPSLSERSYRIPASPIRKLAGAAERARGAGKQILALNIGQPDVSSPAEFWEEIAKIPQNYLAYSHSAGDARLREQAAAYYRGVGIDVATEEVLITTAGSEALQMAMVACLNPGDEVIVPEPMYANYIGFAALADVTVVPIPTRIEENFALPDAGAFAERITPRTKAILINNPGNPTGTVYNDEQLEALRAICLEHDLFLIADEVYRDFNYTGRPIRSVLQLEGMERHAVMIDSVSKRYSLCGARIGFLVSRNADLMQAALRYGMARLSAPTMEQIGVLGALRAPQSYLDGVKEEYMARRDLVVGRLRAMPGVLCPEIDGAFYATVRIPVDDADRFCLWMLEEFALDGVTVQLSPASGFYSTPGAGRDEIRIAYVLEQEKLSLAMDALAAALQVYPGRTADAVPSA